MNPPKTSLNWLTRLVCCLALVALAGGTAACSTASTSEDETPAEERIEKAQPGAEAWQQHALKLPADTPVVVWARPGKLLDNLGQLRRWLFERPDMFGSAGEQLIGQLRRQWEMLTASWEMEPLSSDTVEKVGLDPNGEVYGGIYPVDTGQNRAFVEAVSESVRGRLELDDDETLDDALAELTLFSGMSLPAEFRDELQDQLDVPEGVYRDAEKAVFDKSLFGGFRVVAPLADKQAFRDNVERFFESAQYTYLDLEESKVRVGYDSDDTPNADTYFYYDPEGRLPVVRVDLGDETARIDVLAGRPGQVDVDSADIEAGDREAFEQLDEYIDRLNQGRPAAPRPDADPMVGVAADQRGAVDLARLRGYRSAFEEAEKASVRERDRLFLEQIHQAELSAGNWAAADGQLSGVSYGLFDGADDESLVRLGISLYGAQAGKSLAASQSARHLGVDGRGVGMSLDLAPANDRAWQEWVGLSEPGELIGYFTAAFFDPGLFVLSLPRNAVLLLANAHDVFKKRLPDQMASFLDESELIERFEFASAGVDMRRLREHPRYVGLLTLDNEATDDEIEELSRSLNGAIRDRFRGEQPDEEKADEEAEDPPSLPTGELVAVAEDEADIPIYVLIDNEADEPTVFLSYGLERDEATAQLDRVVESRGKEASAKTAYARIEPIAFLSLVKMLNEDVFEMLDINVVAQRLGALVFSVEPRSRDGVQTIEYDFELRNPPTLDEDDE